MHRLALAAAVAVFSSCNCGERLVPVEHTCETDPSVCPAPPTPQPQPPPTDCGLEICPDKPTPQFGTVAGRVCAGDGHTWLAGADVYVTTGADTRVAAKSDADGRYRLQNVPVGTQTVHIEKGSFSATRTVTVTANMQTTLADDVCELDIAPKVAVVRGSAYDMVQGVLAELGVKTDRLDVYDTDWAEKLLATDHGLDGYDMLFLNCRSYEPTFMARPDMQQRLRDFVARGGKLHASDQAYDIIERAFPSKIDFYGDDNVLHAANEGDIVDKLRADVVDQSLVVGLGKSVIDIHYGLTTWSAMVSTASDVHVYLRATSPLLNGQKLTNAPQIVGFEHGTGHVVYSSFHQEPGIGVDQERILKLLMFEL